jgi:OOP family OmpA-OmpF porin
MATNLLEMMSSAIGPQLVGQAGRFLGASESTMQSAVDAALPALLGGLMQKGSTASGAATLMSLLNTPGLDTGIVGNLGSSLGGGEKTNALLKLGGSLLPGIFGDRTGSLVNSIGAISGLSSSSASNFMALLVAMVLGFLKKHVTQNRLDGGALANLLAGQGDFLKAKLDSRVASALGFASPMAFLSSLTGAAGRAADTAGAAVGRAADTVGAAAGRAAGAAGAFGTAAVSAGGAAAAEGRSWLSRWWPWLLIAAAALILLPQLFDRGQDAAKKVGDTVGEAAKATTQAAADAAKATTDAARAGGAIVAKAVKTFELPNGVKIDVTDGGFMATLIAFLNSKDAALGKGYSFDEVFFDTGSATLKPESTKQLEQLAAVLKAYPAVAISVEGHTDNTGDAAINKTLSAERAAAVEKALATLGVPNAQISSTGYGPGKPVASNDTEDGRAQNRRVEVVVTKR